MGIPAKPGERCEWRQTTVSFSDDDDVAILPSIHLYLSHSLEPLIADKPVALYVEEATLYVAIG